jgi:hypothetical protein
MQTMQSDPMFTAEKAREEAKNLDEMYSSIKETEKASDPKPQITEISVLFLFRNAIFAAQIFC